MVIKYKSKLILLLHLFYTINKHTVSVSVQCYFIYLLINFHTLEKIPGSYYCNASCYSTALLGVYLMRE